MDSGDQEKMWAVQEESPGASSTDGERSGDENEEPSDSVDISSTSHNSTTPTSMVYLGGWASLHGLTLHRCI